MNKIEDKIFKLAKEKNLKVTYNKLDDYYRVELPVFYYDCIMDRPVYGFSWTIIPRRPCKGVSALAYFIEHSYVTNAGAEVIKRSKEIKEWRVGGASWRRISELYCDKYAPNHPLYGIQMHGQDLCREAALLLGEDKHSSWI